MNVLSESDFRTLVGLAEAGVSMQHDPRYQALIQHLLSLDKPVLLWSLLDALGWLKRSGEQEVAERNLMIQQLEYSLKQRDTESQTIQLHMHTLHNELSQFRAIANNQHWGQQHVHSLPQPASSFTGVPMNPANYGRHVLASTYGLQ